MDLAALRIFRTVVREGGVTRAAERLNRVQSNVTTRIRQLEDELGVALFIREGKRLHLAPAGQVLLDYSERLLSLADEARLAVQDSKPRGIFRLGAMESTAAVRLPAALNEYHRRYPDVVLELKTGNPPTLAALILAGELDAALVTEPVADATFEKAPAFVEEAVIVSAASRPRWTGKVSRRARSSPSSTAARTASGWKSGMRSAARCRSGRSSSARITRCSVAWSPAWESRCCRRACCRRFRKANGSTYRNCRPVKTASTSC